MKLDTYLTRLENLERKGRRRNLALADGLDFSSNDYLGLATHPGIKAAVEAALQRGVPLGATGSRLLRGNHAEHEALEAEAAAHFSAPRMIYFGSGYMANLAALSTLPQPGDLIVYDELIHASAHAGIRAGRAEAVGARHNDAQAFEDRIRAWRENGGRGTPWIVVESIYSMDGDQAPLKALHAIATRYNGVLYIDEAHATGVYGANGGDLPLLLAMRKILSRCIPAARRLAAPVPCWAHMPRCATISSIVRAASSLPPPPRPCRPQPCARHFDIA